MEYLSLMLGSLATNCYLLKLGDGKCVIVDIGEGAPVLLRRLETGKLTPCAILLTHGHFDHIAGVEQVREKFQIPVRFRQCRRGRPLRMGRHSPLRKKILPSFTHRDIHREASAGNARICC